MHKIKLLTLFIVILSSPFVSVSQNDVPNGVPIDVIRNFERNYDSLLSSFYLRQNSKVIRNTYSRESDNLCSPTSAKTLATPYCSPTQATPKLHKTNI